MSFCSTVSNGCKSVMFGAGALVATGTFAAAEYLFSTLPSIAKVFGENCPTSVVNPSQICNSLLDDYSRNFYWMLALNGTAFGAAVVANCVGPRLSTHGDEAIPLNGSSQETNTQKIARATVILGGGVALGQLVTNVTFASLTKNVAVSLGRCIAQSSNTTLLNCSTLESGVYAFTTADYVISAATGLFMAGSFIWSAREGCKANRQIIII